MRNLVPVLMKCGYPRHLSIEAVCRVKPVVHYRTENNDPCSHSAIDDQQVYTVRPDDHDRLFQMSGLTQRQRDLRETLQEFSLVVRQPALHVIRCLRDEKHEYCPPHQTSSPEATDSGADEQERLDQLLECRNQREADTGQSEEPAPVADGVAAARRFLFYGRFGVGKLCCLQHVLLAGLRLNRVIVHLPELDAWGMRFGMSTRHGAEGLRPEDMVQHPLEAVQWLSHFLHQNGGEGQRQQLLELQCRRRYEWSQRETTEMGESLWRLAEFGVARARFASSCMAAVMHELRAHAAAGRCRLLVAVERLNALWTPGASLLWRDRAARTAIGYSQFTALQGLWPLLSADWHGGEVVATLCCITYQDTPPQHYLPSHLLGLDGWSTLEPFVPVCVDCFSRREAYNLLDHLADIGWINNPVANSEDGRKQLFALSGGNPRRLMELLRMC